jgi:hypothetical protein
MTAREIIYIASTGPKRYKVYEIGKRKGGTRTICQPSRELKAVQYFFLENVFNDAAVHPAAMAYETGKSISLNASEHADARVILKTDFEAFFPSIRANDWKAYVGQTYPGWNNDDLTFSLLTLFWGAGTQVPTCLSIGAPTSPKLSNMLLWQFDKEMSDYANENGYRYTRYADDVTVSSRDFLDFDRTMEAMRGILRGLRYPKLKLNDGKTGLFSRKGRLQVTGLVLTNEGRVSLGRDRKRAISAMVHKHSVGSLPEHSHNELAGLLAFAQDVEPAFVGRLRRKYGIDVVSSAMAPAPQLPVLTLF